MAQFRGKRSAFGSPGNEARWTDGDKDGIGTSFSSGGRAWFTIRRGILTEIYYPTVDRPQVRDVRYVFADGNGLFLDEQEMDFEIQRLAPSQGYRVITHDRERRFSLTKEVIVEPTRACVLMRAKLAGDEAFLETLRVYLLCAPHLEGKGSGNSAFVVEVSGRELLVAEKNDHWLAIGASCRFSRLSCGYFGSSDGYTDVAAHHKMEFEFDEARDGNVVLAGELDLTRNRVFTVGLAFGERLPNSVSTLFQSLGVPYQESRQLFMRQWKTAGTRKLALEKYSGDEGRLFDASYNLLLTHEDKLYQGAFVASLSIPFGRSRNDDSGEGGYHLVWTRDMVESAMGLLAAGNTAVPLRALIYLASRQEEDGHFPQNFWVNGDPFRNNLQLDEVAFPVLLAWRLHKLRLLGEFDATVLVRRAARFLMHCGPVTGEERWEETGGYSPSTLGCVIAALICAAALARETKENESASFLESYADFLRAHVEEWTVTTLGSLLPGVPRHFIRLNPAKSGDAAAPCAVNEAMLEVFNQPPGCPTAYPARNIVDAGFLELVRYGIYSASDPLMVDSLRVVDATLKVWTPFGPCWRRYNHDGYGQRPDGGSYVEWGQGRAWPLLTGERGHYELAAGHDVWPFIRAIEQFATNTGLLAEQIWDEADLPEADLRCAGPTRSANPLLWAHSEYLRLLRSFRDRQVFELIPEVVDRYHGSAPRTSFEFWLPKHPIRQARKNHTLRICAPDPFRLHWMHAGDAAWRDEDSRSTAAGAEYLDIRAEDFDPHVEFTFFWKDRGEWEGRNYLVEAYELK